ncbi:MAG: hypothetical protein V4697_02310 [Patescibacteria group bacterium]
MQIDSKLTILGRDLRVKWEPYIILDEDGNVISTSFSVINVVDPDSPIAEMRTDGKNPKPQVGDLQGKIALRLARAVSLKSSEVGSFSLKEFIQRLHNKPL